MKKEGVKHPSLSATLPLADVKAVSGRRNVPTTASDEKQ